MKHLISQPASPSLTDAVVLGETRAEREEYAKVLVGTFPLSNLYLDPSDPMSKHKEGLHSDVRIDGLCEILYLSHEGNHLSIRQGFHGLSIFPHLYQHSQLPERESLLPITPVAASEEEESGIQYFLHDTLRRFSLTTAVVFGPGAPLLVDPRAGTRCWDVDGLLDSKQLRTLHALIAEELGVEEDELIHPLHFEPFFTRHRLFF